MDFQTSSVAAKLSTGHSIYDGVFSSAPSKFTVSSSFSSTLDDYRDIFGAASAASSSIPVLEVPELKERKSDTRSSQLDYSNVFGGFADSDSALPYEQLFNQPHKRSKTQKETRREGGRVSPVKEAKRSGCEEGADFANGAAYESIDGVKKFSMSYNQSNNRSKSFAGVHSVPAYTCLVDQTSPLCGNEGDRSVSLPPVVVKEREMESDISVKATSDKVASDAGKQASLEGGLKTEDDSNWKSSIDELFKSNKSVSGAPPSSMPPFSSEVSRVDKPVSLVTNNAREMGGKHDIKATEDAETTDASKQTFGGVSKVQDAYKRRSSGSVDKFKATEDAETTDASKQTFGGVSKVQDAYKWRSSGSVDKFFYSGELTQETRPTNMPSFSSMHYDGKGEHEKSMDSVFRNLNRDIGGADSVSSPTYFDEEADTNSVAAVSVAALTKAIEEAQASIQMAKEMMDWKKDGSQSRVKLNFDNSMKPKSRKGSKVVDKSSIAEERKARELYNKVDVRVHDYVGREQVSPVFVNASTVSDVMVTGEETRGKKFVDNGSISTKKIHESKEELHVSSQPEQVTVELDTDKRSGLMEDRGKVHGKEFQGYLNIFSFFTKKTNALQEDVHVPDQPKQAAVILADTDIQSGVIEARDKVPEQEFEPTPTDHMHEKADDSEVADQFYEFGDTSEQDVSEAADQFYEFADSSEPDVSESQTTEEFYEFADSNEQQDVVENNTAETPRQTFLSVDYDEQEKKTDIEAFEYSEQVVKKSKAATVEEPKGVENISNLVQEVSEFEDNFELASSQVYSKQEDDDESILNVVGVVSDFEENDELTSSHECPKQEDDVNPQEEPRKHEETSKLETTHIKETYEEKQYGDDKRFDTQEAPETTHVDVNLVPQEWDESEKIDKEGCMLEENEREPPYSESEEGTDSISNEDKKEELIESVSFYDKEDFEKRLEDDRNSEQIGKLDTAPNEEKIEEATCQECENTKQEGFEFLKDERIQSEMDESTRNEKEKKTQDCNIEPADNLTEQVVCEELACEELASKQGSNIDVNYDQDVKETVQLPINNENREVKEVAEISIHLVGNEHQIGLVEEENGMDEKEICETDGLTPDAELTERLKQMEDAANTHSFEKDGISASESDMSFVQKQDDQLAGEPSVDYNVGEQVGESEKSGDINSDMMRAEVALNQERNKNSSKSRKRWFGANEVSEPFIKLEGDGNRSESVEEEDVMEEKVISEIEGLASGVRFTEILKQLEDVIDIHPSDKTEASVSGQKHDVQLAREPEEVSCNLLKNGQRFGDINKDIMEPEVAVLNEESINVTKSSHRKRWFDDGKVTEVAQPSPIFGKAGSVTLDNDLNTDLSTKRDKENYHKVMTGQSTEVNEDSQQSTLRHEEGETIPSSSNEFDLDDFTNPKTTLSEEGMEAETNFTSQKDVVRETENQRESKIANDFENSASSQKAVELEKQRLIQKEEKRRERERQKEKRKVAQVIREARERSFADVKERVAETRQKVMAEAQGKSGKASVHTDDALLEKASKEAEAKAKRERSFVERANAEARDRALEKALSEKAAAEASKQAKWSPASTEKQAKRSVSERFAGSSGENRQSRSLDLESKGPFSSSISRSPNSTNQSDPSPAGQSTTNGESAQRCKAILERNQRTAERAAKALAEKNNRDLLVQQEQAERNRLAEVIDAEVKRWSSGKERNLRALLSTLQYILGPDSGWQPVHLTDIVTAVAVKKAYRKAALYVHPDKLQQRGASIQQKYTCEKVFDLLKDAWNRFSMEER